MCSFEARLMSQSDKTDSGHRCRVLKASAFGTVDSALIPSRVKPLPVKLLFTAFLVDAHAA